MSIRESKFCKKYIYSNKQPSNKNLLCLLVSHTLVALLCTSCHLLFPSRSRMPANMTKFSSGQLSGTIKIEKPGQYSRYLHTDIYILNTKDDLLFRMDLHTSLFFPLLSLISKKQLTTMLFFTSREYYQTHEEYTIFKSIFSLELSLEDLKNIFFDQPLDMKKWKCSLTPAKLPHSCQQGVSVVQWSRREGKTQILISNPRFHIEFLFSHFTPSVKEKVFDISVPSNYKLIPQLPLSDMPSFKVREQKK